MKKVAIKCLSVEHGQEIKKYFEGTPTSLRFDSIGSFYFIDMTGEIARAGGAPGGYTEIELPFVPRYMYVSDDSEDDALNGKARRYVKGIFKGHFVSTGDQKESLNAAELFVFAVEIPVETTKVKKGVIAKMFGSDFENIEFID